MTTLLTAVTIGSRLVSTAAFLVAVAADAVAREAHTLTNIPDTIPTWVFDEDTP